jgi:hemerythrin-like domain-containing protein
MAKIDNFSIIHKGIRACITICITNALACDLSKGSTKSLARDINEMIELITTHAMLEDNFIFNQEKLLSSRAGSIVQKLEREHIELHEREALLAQISKELIEKRTSDKLQSLRDELESYKTVMWNHLEEEETQVNDAMNEIYTVQEMDEITKSLVGSIKFRDRMLMTKYLFPATTTHEKLYMMGDPNPSNGKVAVLGGVVFPFMNTISRCAVALSRPAAFQQAPRSSSITSQNFLLFK